MIKEIFAKFGSTPALLASALKLHTENEKLTFSEIVAKVEGEQTAAELATLRSGKSELEGEITTLKSAATAHNAELAKLSAAGLKAAEGKTAVDVALAKIVKLEAELAAKVTDIATLRAGGTVPINTGAAPAGAAASAAGLTGVARAGAAFKARFAEKKVGQN